MILRRPVRLSLKAAGTGLGTCREESVSGIDAWWEVLYTFSSSQWHSQSEQFGILQHRGTLKGHDHPRRGEHLPRRGRGISSWASQSTGGAGEAQNHQRAAKIHLEATIFVSKCGENCGRSFLVEKRMSWELFCLFPRWSAWKMRGWASRCVPASGWRRARPPVQRR